jgi:hypothetical protein
MNWNLMYGYRKIANSYRKISNSSTSRVFLLVSYILFAHQEAVFVDFEFLRIVDAGNVEF